MVQKLVDGFSNFTVLVMGDVMIDAYLQGDVGRISPEAPVPIVDVRKRYYRLGGAANVALNLQALGANVIICSVVGNDDKAVLFENLMIDKQLETNALLHSDLRRTTIKYRIIGNGRQMMRIDEENVQPLAETEKNAYLSMVKNILDTRSVDAVIFEDYDKGVLSCDVIKKTVEWARNRNVLVTVDPKKRNFSDYQNVTLFKPNLKELCEGLEIAQTEFSLVEVEQRMRTFAKEKHIDYLFTTLSERGVAMYDSVRNIFYTEPAYLRKISDVSGAGDTVIAVATLCLLSDLSAQTTARIANLAGGIVCEYAGVTPIPIQQLADEILQKKILK